jgi:hypothetical protein
MVHHGSLMLEARVAVFQSPERRCYGDEVNACHATAATPRPQSANAAVNAYM